MGDVRQYLLNDQSFVVFGIVETRLGPEGYDNIIDIKGYSILRQDCNIRGCRILLYIKNKG